MIRVVDKFEYTHPEAPEWGLDVDVIPEGWLRLVIIKDDPENGGFISTGTAIALPRKDALSLASFIRQHLAKGGKP